VSLKPDLEKILKDLLEDLKEDVVGCAFIRLNGSMIAAKLPSGEDEQMVATLSATINDAARKLCGSLKRGELLRTLIEGSDGKIVFMPIGRGIVLAAVTSEKPNLGLILIEMEKAAEYVKALLRKPRRSEFLSPV